MARAAGDLARGLVMGLICATTAPAQGFDPLAADPPPGTPAAQMRELAIPSHGARLFGVFYGAGGAAPHPTVVLLHGFAGFEQNEDLAQAIRRAGFNTLIFHYRGAWGSEGTFSFAHCIADTLEVLAYLRSHAQELAVDPRRLVLLGHSVGGLTAGIATAADPAVAGLAMISPANRRLTLGQPGAAQVLRAHYREELGPLRGATPGALVAELQAHADSWDLAQLAPRWQERPVLLISSDDAFKAEDAAVAAAAARAGLRSLRTEHFATDHAYSGARVALTRALLDWLRQFR